MLHLRSLHLLIAVAVMTMLSLSSSIPPHVAAQVNHDIQRRDVLSASAIWLLESDGGFERTLNLFVDKSRDGVEIFVSMTTDSGSELFGHYANGSSNGVFTMDRNLDEAVLSPVSIDTCYFDLLDENGDCTEVIETLKIQAEWTGIDSKSSFNEKKVLSIVSSREMTLVDGTSRNALAMGSVNETELGNAAFSFLSRQKLLAVDFGEPNKPPRLDLFGNRGTIAAHATWVDTTIDDEPAVVRLAVDKEIKGSMTIELLIGLHHDDGTTEFLKGILAIPANSSEENVFAMDLRAATAKLNAVDITVCDIEFGGDCSNAPTTATYTAEAEWNGIEEAAFLQKLTTRSSTAGSNSRIVSNGVVMLADVEGSIDGNSLGDNGRGELFHSIFTSK